MPPRLALTPPRCFQTIQSIAAYSITAYSITAYSIIVFTRRLLSHWAVSVSLKQYPFYTHSLYRHSPFARIARMADAAQ